MCKCLLENVFFLLRYRVNLVLTCSNIYIKEFIVNITDNDALGCSKKQSL